MNSRELYFRLLRYVKPHRRHFATSIIATIILASTEPAMPALFKPLLDGSFVNKDPTYINWMPVFLMVIFVIRGLANYVSTVAMTKVANYVVHDLREQLFHNLLNLPLRFLDDNPSGNLLSKLNYDVTQVTSAATNAVTTLVRDTLAVIGLLGWMLYLNWKLTLLFFIVVPVIGGMVRSVSKRMRRLNHDLQNSMGNMTHVLEEAIQGNKVVKIFGGQDYEQRRYHRIINLVRNLQVKTVAVATGHVSLVQLVTAMALGVIIYLASLEALHDQLTVGGFVSFVGAMAMLFSPIKRLTGINEQLQRGLAAAESVFKLLDEPAEADTGTQALTRAAGKVEFVDVSFRYHAGSKVALDHINLNIQPGETVALVGASGSGKSSLVSLLPRFYQPTSGKILVDGVDIRELRLADLRGNMAFVDQHVVLFNDTVAANIAYGKLDQADTETIREAARAAHALEFIEKMERGFETLIGEDGVRLSGGQRQRLAIARAVLKNAPILIFDEATSALDTESERHVQEALDTLRQGRTTIVIAHRLSTIQHADRIVVLEDGEIKEIGTHQQLLAENGIYARLYQLQFAKQAGSEPAPVIGQ